MPPGLSPVGWHHTFMAAQPKATDVPRWPVPQHMGTSWAHLVQVALDLSDAALRKASALTLQSLLRAAESELPANSLQEATAGRQ
mmetsp:Transcript_57944/g.187796  ORF Transcript_57944/g.187796 Transcript_57944/m.187796 type:complete len:85 (-) Transcript_57944:55-309(-)